jgi:hypothetical protein
MGFSRIHRAVLVEAYFANKSYINSQTTRIWAAENPHELHQVPLHTEKIVWCAISRRRIIGPTFFDTTVTSAVYALCNSLWRFWMKMNDTAGTNKMGRSAIRQMQQWRYWNSSSMTASSQRIFGLLALRTWLPPRFFLVGLPERDSLQEQSSYSCWSKAQYWRSS